MSSHINRSLTKRVVSVRCLSAPRRGRSLSHDVCPLFPRCKRTRAAAQNRSLGKCDVMVFAGPTRQISALVHSTVPSDVPQDMCQPDGRGGLEPIQGSLWKGSRTSGSMPNNSNDPGPSNSQKAESNSVCAFGAHMVLCSRGAATCWALKSGPAFCQEAVFFEPDDASVKVRPPGQETGGVQQVSLNLCFQGIHFYPLFKSFSRKHLRRVLLQEWLPTSTIEQ